MASTPDLAAAIRKLCLSFDDDYTLEVAHPDSLLERSATHDIAASSQEKNPSILPETKATHTYDNITGALVPAAYLRHKIALVEAFRACKKVAELWIEYKAVEPERMHRYKRSSRRNRNGPPADDYGQDTEGSEDEDDFASDEEDSGGSDGAEREDEDFNGSDEDAEHHDEHFQDRRDILFDITSSYNYALHLAAEAGMHPKQIGPFRLFSKNILARVCTGLTDCAGLPRSKPTLERLETLTLSFVHHQHVPRVESSEV